MIKPRRLLHILFLLLVAISTYAPLGSASDSSLKGCDLCKCIDDGTCFRLFEWLLLDRTDTVKTSKALRWLYTTEGSRLCSGESAENCLGALLQYHRSLDKIGRLAALEFRCHEVSKSSIDGCDGTVGWDRVLHPTWTALDARGRRLSLVGHSVTGIVTIFGFVAIVAICVFFRQRWGFMERNGFVPIPVEEGFAA